MTSSWALKQPVLRREWHLFLHLRLPTILSLRPAAGVLSKSDCDACIVLSSNTSSPNAPKMWGCYSLCQDPQYFDESRYGGTFAPAWNLTVTRLFAAQ